MYNYVNIYINVYIYIYARLTLWPSHDSLNFRSCTQVGSIWDCKTASANVTVQLCVRAHSIRLIHAFGFHTEIFC